MVKASRVAIIYKTRDTEAQKVIETIKRLLNPSSVEEFSTAMLMKEGLRGFDIVFSLGGDGTLLKTSRAIREESLILPVNLGKKGYLIEVLPENLEDHLNKYCRGDFLLEKCFKLKVEHGGSFSTAVNDVVVRNAVGLKQVTLFVELKEGSFKVEGDGLLISSPLGSSAYSLNAGGPFVMSSANVMICTPLCTRRPQRPLIVPKDEVIKVKYLSGEETSLIIDGEEMHRVDPEATIKVTASDEVVNIIRFSKEFNIRRMHRLIGDYENG
ncbi:MAG: NAD(+)/NADH kinase [Thermoproteota archaeon]